MSDPRTPLIHLTEAKATSLTARTDDALAPLPPPGSLRALIQSGTPTEVSRALADVKAALESRLEEAPNDYWALVTLGELDLRIGLLTEAQALLYHASLQRQPDWESYQYLSYLLRRAEEQQQHAMDRPAGVPPPLFLRRSVGSITARIVSTIRRFRVGRWT